MRHGSRDDIYGTKPVAALPAGYGLNLSQEILGSINGLVLAVLLFVTRGQVTPTSNPPPTDDTVVR